MSVYLIRHGATQMNMERLIQGHIDEPLVDKGRQMARDAADELRSQGIMIREAYSSPLKRAVETASIISGVEMDKVTTLPDVIEIEFGIHDGESLVDISPEEHATVFEYPSKQGEMDGVETYESLMVRSKRFLKFARELAKKDHDVIVCAHGGIMRAILSVILNVPMEELWSRFNIPHCKTYRLDLDPEDASGAKDSAEVVIEGYKISDVSKDQKDVKYHYN